MKKTLHILGLVAAFALASPAFSQTLTFTASNNVGAGSITPTLTWSTTPAASSCTASGHASWTGTKAASGTTTLPAIALSGTYTLTMSCNWPGDTTATVNWVAPTLNTDGSSLTKCPATTAGTGTCLAGFRIYRRLNNSDLSTSAEMTPVDDQNLTSRAFTGLVAGTHYFGLEAVNDSGTPSAMSEVKSKVITATASANRSVTVTVNPKPSSPTGLTVE